MLVVEVQQWVEEDHDAGEVRGQYSLLRLHVGLNQEMFQ